VALSEALVDPNILSQQPGSSPDSREDAEGANYLRRLKGEVVATAPAAAPANTDVKSSGRDPEAAASVSGTNRRQSPRLRCSGSAEIRTEGSDVRLWGTLTDISLHGCYVEMNVTFPVDTKVALLLKSCGIRIQTSGTIRASYPFLGMGIGFVDIEPEQQLQLKQLLTTLGGQSAIFRGAPAPENPLNDALRSVDPRALLGEITEFFRKNQLLSRDEFQQIAKRVRRS
jgi:hypothetical protein